MGAIDDYDPAILADLKPAVARLRIPNYGTEGTGFLVAPDQLITCQHVVKDLAIGGEVQCRFGQSSKDRTAKLVRWDVEADVALLRLDEPIADAKPLELANDNRRFTRWLGYGFPAFTDGIGVPFVGGVADPDVRDRDGQSAILVNASMLTGEDVSLGGVSGTPILYGALVVGMLYRVLGAPGSWSATHFGLLYAAPVSRLQVVLDGGAMPVPPPPAPTDDEARHPKLVSLLLRLRLSAHAAEALQTINELRREQLATLDVLLQAGEILLDMGAANDVIGLLGASPEDERARQLVALAHSLRGEHTIALAMLKTLPPSSETGGIAGSVEKRRYLETKNVNHLRAALLEYEKAYETTQDPYPGINAAALALWLGDGPKSRKLAGEVLARVTAQPEAQRNHWGWATLGEARLLLGDRAAASRDYGHAVALNPGGARAIASMRTDARINLECLGFRRDELDSVVSVGAVACVTGLRIDSPGAVPARFPESKVGAVTGALKRAIDKYKIQFGFGSAASGADLLFAEALLERGGEVSIFLPFPAVDFIGTSVGAKWRSRFKGVLDRLAPSRIVITNDETPASEVAKNEAYARCNELVQRETADAARILGERPVLIAVVVPAGGVVPRGGTEDAIRLWKERDRGEVVEIDPLTVR